MARMSLTFFCCGRINRKYMIAKISTKGKKLAKAEPAPAAPAVCAKAGVTNMEVLSVTGVFPLICRRAPYRRAGG
ncbi:MAG: hypothetical protein ACD_54C00737G0001 [uncultured bacterium]|nr:MAG: hypothetical protein ACD_54C00737G0001 [uncultured bacterium]